MIVIQLILIAGLVLIAINFLGSRKSSRTKAIKKLLLLLSIPVAIFFVLLPSITTQIAHHVGVGRGADLLLYGLFVIVVFQAFDGYVRNKEDYRRTVKIVRRIAIIEANEKYQKTSQSKHNKN